MTFLALASQKEQFPPLAEYQSQSFEIIKQHLRVTDLTKIVQGYLNFDETERTLICDVYKKKSHDYQDLAFTMRNKLSLFVGAYPEFQDLQYAGSSLPPTETLIISGMKIIPVLQVLLMRRKEPELDLSINYLQMQTLTPERQQAKKITLEPVFAGQLDNHLLDNYPSQNQLSLVAKCLDLMEKMEKDILEKFETQDSTSSRQNVEETNPAPSRAVNCVQRVAEVFSGPIRVGRVFCKKLRNLANPY